MEFNSEDFIIGDYLTPIELVQHEHYFLMIDGDDKNKALLFVFDGVSGLTKDHKNSKVKYKDLKTAMKDLSITTLKDLLTIDGDILLCFSSYENGELTNSLRLYYSGTWGYSKNKPILFFDTKLSPKGREKKGMKRMGKFKDLLDI